MPVEFIKEIFGSEIAKILDYGHEVSEFEFPSRYLGLIPFGKLWNIYIYPLQ